MTMSMVTRIILATAFCLAALAGCAGPSTGSSPLGSPTSALRPSPTTRAASASAAIAASGGWASSGPASSHAAASPGVTARPTNRPAASPASGLITISNTNAGSTIRLALGERLLVKLGTDLDWTVTVSNPAVLARVPGVTVVRGAQGLYRAQKAGTAKISAVGDPACRKSTPPCMAPSQLVSVTVIVK